MFRNIELNRLSLFAEVVNREQAIFFSVVIITASLLGALSSATSNSLHPGGPTSEGQSVVCSGEGLSVNTSLSWSTRMVTVLQLDPGKIGHLCLDYRFQKAVPAGFRPSIAMSSITSTNESFSAVICGGTNGTETFLCPGIDVSLAWNPSSQNSETVAVNVTAGPTAMQGLYWLWLGEPCSPTPFFVGPAPDKITSMEASTFGCITTLNPPTVQIVGSSGFRVLTLNVIG